MLSYMLLHAEPACGQCHRHLLSHTGETVPHVVCTQCRDAAHSDFALHLCVWCFANHPDSPPGHSSRAHAYRVGCANILRAPQQQRLTTNAGAKSVNLETVPSPVDPAWTMKETMAIIRGFKKFGFENWEDIAAKAVGGARTPAECHAYYERLRVAMGDEPFSLPDMAAVDQASKRRLAAIAPLAASVGYMPLRDEFEVVHANDAEALLADMEFGGGGDGGADVDCGPDWTGLKLQVLRNYNRKLDERAARKRFVLERDLLDFKRVQLASIQQAGNAEDAKLMRLIEPLARFGAHADYLALVQGLLRERNLRAEIRRLQDLRAVGVRTLAEAETRARLVGKSAHGVLPDVDDAFPHAGTEHLTPRELAVCAELRISALHFIAIKDALLHESLRTGAVRRGELANLVVDVNAGSAVLDFLVAERMIEERAAV